MAAFDFPRIVLLSGHYGSGKTNIAVNLACWLRERRERVAIADIDIVNPYFRTKDSQDLLREKGIQLISSPYAGSNVDLPALPQEVYAITDDQSLTAVIDVGGDDRGALALGRWRDAILRENSYEMLFVINRYRPLTRTPEAAIEIMHEIEYAAGMRFTAIASNSNLGALTTEEDILSSVPYAEAVSALSGLPVKLTSVDASLYPRLAGRIPDLFPLTLQARAV